MEQKPLWEFTPLYASLLSEEELIRSCSESWSTSIFEEKDHRMILREIGSCHFEIYCENDIPFRFGNILCR